MSKLVFTKVSTVILVAVLGLTILACSEAYSSKPAITSSATPDQRASKKSLPKVSSQLTTANTRFGFKLFSQVLQQESKRNVFISPTSVAIALSLTYNGADGTTKAEMAKALQLNGLALEVINQENANLTASLADSDPQVQLSIANSLWARQGVTFNPDFLERSKTFYHAQVISLDFAAPTAAQMINDWVSQNTQGKISKIVDRLQPDDVMFLINAIYFKGKWANEFDPKQTVDRPFHRLSGQAKQQPLMTQSDRYPYYETDQFQAVSLPYGKGRMSLYIFLPKPNHSLTTFYQTLTAENWQTWMSQFSKREGTVQVPRFKLEYGIDLKPALSALGMAVAFDPNRADFTKLSNSSPYIDQVKHKTFVEVNEEGTEAAAATSIGISVTSVQTISPFQMTVDRPFFCAIRDNQTGTLLFMGSIVDPY